MTSIINASPSNGIVQTADGSGVLKVQSNGVTTNALAWVNFNGTGTVAIRSSYNVSSITDNGVGDYTINFTNATSDSNYSVIAMGQEVAGPSFVVMYVSRTAPYSTTSVRLSAINSSGTNNSADSAYVNVAIFGN